MIYLMRHGRAIGVSPDGDDARWLTVRGRDEAAQVARELAARGLTLDAVVSSPLVRAVQTAEIAAAALGFAGPRQIEPSLRPDGAAHVAAVEVAALGAEVLVVSHEPLVSALCAHLTGVRGGFRTAEVRALDEGRVLWQLAP